MIYHSKGCIKGQQIGRSILVCEDELYRFVTGGVKTETVQQ